MRYFLNIGVGPPEVATREGVAAAPSRLGAVCPAAGAAPALVKGGGVTPWP